MYSNYFCCRDNFNYAVASGIFTKYSRRKQNAIISIKFFRYQNNTDTESVNMLNSVIYSEKK